MSLKKWSDILHSAPNTTHSVAKGADVRPAGGHTQQPLSDHGVEALGGAAAAPFEVELGAPRSGVARPALVRGIRVRSHARSWVPSCHVRVN